MSAESAFSIHRTACPLDCPDSCSLDAHVTDGRLTKLDGNHRNPVTAGFICSKVRRYDRHVYGADRVPTPLRRIGGKGDGAFEPVPWDVALSEVAAQLRRVAEAHGGEAILPFSYGGSNGTWTQDTLDARLFRRLGASRLARTVCAAATTAAAVGLYGKMAGVSYEDYPEARLVVVWGANPSASGIHLVPFIREAVNRGAKLVVVDPRRTPLAKQADLHLALRPGTDLPLALALIHHLFETGGADREFLRRHASGAEELRSRARAWPIARTSEVCGVDGAAIESFAELYARESPAVIRCGWGQERNRNGGGATAAILALPAVAGKFGVRGGGYTASNSGAFPLGLESVINEPAPDTRILNMNRLGRQLLDPDTGIHALFVYNANPVATLPRQDLVQEGLAREDLFTVVFEQVMTDTARYADIVLPATTFLEHHDLRKAYGAYALQTVGPVIDPVGEARPNVAVFEALLEALDLTKPDDISAEALPGSLDRVDGLSEDQRRELVRDGQTKPAFGGRPIQMVDVRPQTVDGKIYLVPESLDGGGQLYRYLPDPATEEAPLTLLSPATRRTISSTLGQLGADSIPVELHRSDAEARGLRSGDRVRVWNGFGEVHCAVQVSDDLRPGVASLPKGMWCRQTESGNTGNTLVPDTYTDLGDGACFNDARVQIEGL
ncbi:MAG: molybdopterin-dependent oxidoreductase [Acidobacteriota bacterium]